MRHRRLRGSLPVAVGDGGNTLGALELDAAVATTHTWQESTA
jgi:hypothetical protein